MARSSLRAVFAVVASLTLLGGIASADTSAGTGLSIQASKTLVAKGRLVRISGRLSSKIAECRHNQLVSLKDQGAADRTGRAGRYSFTVKVNKPTTFKAEFDGAVLGTHPTKTTCRRSHSSAVTVRIKPPSHSSVR